MTYQQYRDQIAQLRNDLAMRDRSSAVKDERIAMILDLCGRYATPGSNPDAHALANKVLHILGVRGEFK